jgi:hypothetical protein
MITVLIGWGLLIGYSRKTRKIHDAQSARARRTRVEKCACGSGKPAVTCTHGLAGRNARSFEANGRRWCAHCSSLWRDGSCVNVRCPNH